MESKLMELMEFEDIRHVKSTNIIKGIHALPISQEWKKIFSNLCTGRTWYGLSKTQQSQMINIAKVDSPAIKFLMTEHRKKAGLKKMEKIAVEIPNEKDRQKAMLAILDKGAKKATRDIDLIIASHKAD